MRVNNRIFDIMEETVQNKGRTGEKTKTVEALFTIEETAKYLKISKPSLYRLMADGKITPIKIGGRTLFPEEELTRFVNQLKAEAKAKSGKPEE